LIKQNKNYNKTHFASITLDDEDFAKVDEVVKYLRTSRPDFLKAITLQFAEQYHADEIPDWPPCFVSRASKKHQADAQIDRKPADAQIDRKPVNFKSLFSVEDKRKIVNLRELSELTTLSKERLYGWVRKREIPAIRHGRGKARQWLFRREDLEIWWQNLQRI